MTDLRAQLERRMDELAEEGADGGSGLVDPTRFYAFCAGADAMLELLWPCVDAANVKFYCNCIEDVCDHVKLRDTLTALKLKLGEK